MTTTIIAKMQANSICQECGSTELIQAHHQIPQDDDSLINLCASCHSKKHPNVPKALFFSIKLQLYWCNKSASSLARECGVHPRTIIRTAKKLNVLRGLLSRDDEQVIKNSIKIKPSNGLPNFNTTPNTGFFTARELAKYLNRSYETIRRWCQAKKIPAVKIGGTWLIQKQDIARLFTNTGAGSEHAAETEKAL